MERNEVLREIQKRIAEAKGWTDIVQTVTAGDPPQPGQNLLGRHPDRVGVHLIPRWPWDWCAAGELWADMAAAPGRDRLNVEIRRARTYVTLMIFPDKELNGGRGGHWGSRGETEAEAVAWVWLAWKGIDLSGLR